MGGDCFSPRPIRLIPLGERHFRRAVAEFGAHYHGERNHQGLGNELIDGTPDIAGIGRFVGNHVSAACLIITVARREPLAASAETWDTGSAAAPWWPPASAGRMQKPV